MPYGLTAVKHIAGSPYTPTIPQATISFIESVNAQCNMHLGKKDINATACESIFS